MKELKQDMSKNNYSTKRPWDKQYKSKTKRCYRTNTSKYCWTCGARIHLSKDWRKNAANHKDDTALTNKMGRCTDVCQVVKWQKGTEDELITNSKISKIDNVYHSFSAVPPKQIIKVKIDSGVSNHYTRSEDVHVLDKVSKHVGPAVTFPYAGVVTPLHKGILPLSKFSTTAKTATVLPGLKRSSLLSVGMICVIIIWWFLIKTV